MNRRLRLPASSSAASLDLNAFDNLLARLLRPLLFMRDYEALIRWSKTRSWVDNAMAGEPSVDLLVIDMALAYLAKTVADDARPEVSPDDDEGHGR